MSLPDYRQVQDSADGGLGLAALGFLVSSILFLIWFFQAYTAAASRGPRGTNWGAGWTVGSWFIPVANAVIPKLVMNEVDRMSNPDAGEPPIEERWKGMRRLTVSDVWWITLLMAAAVHTVSFVLLSSSGYRDDTYGAGLLLVSIWMILYAVSGVLLGVTVKTIGGRLRR